MFHLLIWKTGSGPRKQKLTAEAIPPTTIIHFLIDCTKNHFTATDEIIS